MALSWVVNVQFLQDKSVLQLGLGRWLLIGTFWQNTDALVRRHLCCALFTKQAPSCPPVSLTNVMRALIKLNAPMSNGPQIHIVTNIMFRTGLFMLLRAQI